MKCVLFQWLLAGKKNSPELSYSPLPQQLVVFGMAAAPSPGSLARRYGTETVTNYHLQVA